MNGRPRVFVGIEEVCDITLRLAQGFRACGCPTRNVVFETDSALLRREDSHDDYLPRPKSLGRLYAGLARAFAREALRHDLFVFNFAKPFLPFVGAYTRWLRRVTHLDWRVLRALGKTIAVVSNGSDLRSYAGLLDEMAAAGVGTPLQREVLAGYAAREDLRLQRTMAEQVDRYAHHVFARPNSAQLLRRPYHPLWIPLNVDTVTYRIPRNLVPLVVHAPSKRAIKGTRFVLDAVERLRLEGRSFRFRLLEDSDNREVRRALAEADIVVDQVILPGYGLFAVEAMASGCAVLGSAVPGFNGFGPDLPLVSTAPETVYENLKSLLGDRARVAEIAERGRRYVNLHHDHRTVSAGMLAAMGYETSAAAVSLAG